MLLCTPASVTLIEYLPGVPRLLDVLDLPGDSEPLTPWAGSVLDFLLVYPGLGGPPSEETIL